MRLIDADVLLDLIDGGYDIDFTDTPELKRELLNMVDYQETIDAVPIVRCKDCKWWVREGNDSFGYAMFCDHDCSLGGQGVKKPDDYCSYGERKEQNDGTAGV